MAVGGECGSPASATQPPPGCGQPALEPRLVLARARGTQDRWVGGRGAAGARGRAAPPSPGVAQLPASPRSALPPGLTETGGPGAPSAARWGSPVIALSPGPLVP